MIHWWIAGMFCPAPLAVGEATREPDMVTCPQCRMYVEMRCVQVGGTPEQIGNDVRKIEAR